MICFLKGETKAGLYLGFLKNIRYIRLCSLVLTIKHAVRFSTGGKDSHRLISAQFALLAFELFATRARRFFIVAVEKESR